VKTNMSNLRRSLSDSPSVPHSEVARLPWASPTLRELGRVADATHTIDRIGRNDGGSGGAKRT
jgi:hypothetical protein